MPPNPTDTEDPKSMADLIQSAVDEFHKAVERQDGEIKAFGTASGETVAMVEKLNQRLDELDLKMQQASIPAVAVSDSDGGSATPESKARSASFFKWVRYGMTSLSPDERKALVEDDTGGYLITPELDTEIVRTLPQITVIRPLCTVRPISKDSLKVRAMSEVSVGWGKLETGTPITESTATPSAPTYQYVEDLYGLTKIGEDELMDSDVNLTALLADSFSRALGEAEEAAFAIGVGHASEQPEGISVNARLITDCKTTASADAVIIEDFLDMVYGCPTKYRKNGKFLMSSIVELAVRKLRAVDGAGTNFGPFLWQPSLVAGTPSTFLGYPIFTQDNMADLSGTTGIIAAFGDYKAGYRILDRQGITLQRLSELYAEAGLVGFKVHKRVGGGVTRAANKPIVLLKEHA